jgi:2-dehydropantoate 2-reductase
LRITILGAGAIGSLLGGFLAKEHDVTLVCRESHALAIRNEGLRIIGLSDFHVRPRAVVSIEGLEPPEILFITVKAYDTEKAIEDAKPIIELIKEKMPDARLVAGITSHGAILRSPGLVEHTGSSYTTVGPGADAAAIASLLTSSGFEANVSRDIRADIWCKAIVNAVINPLGTLLIARNGAVIERPELMPLAERIADEGLAVANASGIILDRKEVLSKVVKVATETANNICSMRLDVERGRRTEIMQINGAIARYGNEHNIQTPVNSLISALIMALEPQVLAKH